MDTMTQCTVSKHSFTTHDSVDLLFRHWPVIVERHGAVMVFHRGHEHSNSGDSDSRSCRRISCLAERPLTSVAATIQYHLMCPLLAEAV
jgi:hypothetical protein